MYRSRVGPVVALAALLLTAGTSVFAQDPGREEVDAVLQRIGNFVERYYLRAQSLVSEVEVRLRPLKRDLSPYGSPRRLRYEMRLEWEPGEGDEPPLPVVMRDLLEADGRPAKPGDDPECSDPKLESPEPLAIFLPQQRDRFSFTWAGRGREGGREAVMLEYQARGDDPPTVSWSGPCVKLELPGMTRGRVWADAQTGGVLRLDERLTGMFEFDVPAEHRTFLAPRTMTVERADSTIRYRSVSFSDPEETLLLPVSVEVMTAWRNASVQRELVTHDISNYRRFVTRARIVQTPRRP